MNQSLKHKQSFQNIASLVQSSSLNIRLLSKALTARLIPSDTVKDERAVLIVLDNNEVNYLVRLLESSQTMYTSLPILPMVMDLSRSPHNMFAFVFEDVASILADIMDSVNEREQSILAQLIWRMMTFIYEGNEEVSALIINNGTLCSEEGILINQNTTLVIKLRGRLGMGSSLYSRTKYQLKHIN